MYFENYVSYILYEKILSDFVKGHVTSSAGGETTLRQRWIHTDMDWCIVFGFGWLYM